MPAGLDVTVPEPLEDEKFSVRENNDGPANVAVTFFAASIVMAHVVDVPPHTPPLHPLNEAPEPGAAVSVTTVPAL